jgi:hypothetical protein
MASAAHWRVVDTAVVQRSTFQPLFDLLLLLLLVLLQVAAAGGSSRDARPIPGGAAELAKVRSCRAGPCSMAACCVSLWLDWRRHLSVYW